MCTEAGTDAMEGGARAVSRLEDNDGLCDHDKGSAEGAGLVGPPIHVSALLVFPAEWILVDVV